MYTEPTVKRRKLGLNSLEQKEEINIHPEQNEETRIQKNEERFRNLQDIFKYSNIWVIGTPEGEEEEQKLENLFEKIMENFPNLAKEIDFQEIQEAQRTPTKLDSKKHTPKHIIITLPRMNDKERILKVKRKGNSHLQSSSHKTISWFLKRNLSGKKGLERSIQSHERQAPTSKITLSSKTII